MRINMNAIPQVLLNHYHSLWDDGKLTSLRHGDIIIYNRQSETLQVHRPYETLAEHCLTRPLKVGRTLEDAGDTWLAPGSLSTHLSLIVMISGMTLRLLEGAVDADPNEVNVYMVEKR
jgi:hypothetical protein